MMGRAGFINWKLHLQNMFHLRSSAGFCGKLGGDRERSRNYMQPCFCITLPAVSIHLWLTSFIFSSNPTWLQEEVGGERIIIFFLPLHQLKEPVRMETGAAPGR